MSHDYHLYLAIIDIKHTKTKMKLPQTNGNLRAPQKTNLHGFYQAIFRKKLYGDLETLQKDPN